MDPMTITPRNRRTCEAYQVECVCGAKYEQPAHIVDATKSICCPSCGHLAEARWPA
jgi:hypothetical protein